MHRDERGISVAEVLVAVGLLAVASVAATRLLAWSARTVWAAGASISAHALAQARLEQLGSLAWWIDESGAPSSDVTTNLAEQPATTGGTGLSPSPGGTLDANVAGFVDFLDGEGQWAGTGSHAPPSAMFVRRWAIRPYGADPGNTIILQVRVVPLASVQGTSPLRVPGEALLTTALTRVRR